MIKQVNLKVALFGEFRVIMTASSFKEDGNPAAQCQQTQLWSHPGTQLPQQRGPYYKQRKQNIWEKYCAAPRNLKISRTITLQIPISHLRNVNQAVYCIYWEIMKVNVKIRPLSWWTTKDINEDLLA